MYNILFQAEDGIQDAQESGGLGDVYKEKPQGLICVPPPRFVLLAIGPLFVLLAIGSYCAYSFRLESLEPIHSAWNH